MRSWIASLDTARWDGEWGMPRISPTKDDLCEMDGLEFAVGERRCIELVPLAPEVLMGAGGLVAFGGEPEDCIAGNQW